jgi:hypothetical protein
MPAPVWPPRRLTQLVSDPGQRYRAGVYESRAALMAQQRAFFAGPRDDSPIPRASASFDLDNRGQVPTTRAASLSGRTAG